MEVWRSFDTWANGLGDAILEWALDKPIPAHTADWPMGQFSHALGTALGYLAFVLLGTQFMKTVKFETKGTAIYALSFCYNIVQVMLCSYMTIHAGILAYRNGYSVLPCNAANLEKPPMAELLWLFYISKILDFMDTFFIIVKRSWKQLSFLHVYHHFTIFLIYWLNIRANYDGDVYLTIVLNGFIHSVMYTYYFVSLHTRHIWWKPYLTSAQMVQFTTMIAQASIVLAKDCGTLPPRRIAHLYFYYIFTLLALFAQFFVKSYMVKPEKKKTP